MHNHSCIGTVYRAIAAGLLFSLLPVKELRAQNFPASFDTLGGPLPKTVKAKTYIIVTDIEVPANKTVTIEPGTVFLFKNFTGMKVQGILTAAGLKTEPIVFTSEFDRAYNPYSSLDPNPYDWNGIYIHSDAFGTRLENCIVAYTVYGIKSDTRFIKLDPVKLISNGKNNVMIEGETRQITGEEFRYFLSERDLIKEGLSRDMIKDPLSKKRNFLRYTGLVVLLGGFTAGIYYETKFSNSQKEWQKLNAYPPDQGIINQFDSNYYKRIKDKRNTDLALMLSGCGIGLLGTVGFIWSFTF